MDIFLNWIMYGFVTWFSFIAIAITGFNAVDRYGQLPHMIFYVAVIRSLLWVIPLSWFIYGIYLVFGI